MTSRVMPPATSAEVIINASSGVGASDDLRQRLADSFNYLGEYEKAAAGYTQLVERFPHFPEARNKLAETEARRRIAAQQPLAAKEARVVADRFFRERLQPCAAAKR